MSADKKLATETAGTPTQWVVFTGKLPAQMKKQLKIVAAQTGIKQQEIVADAVKSWMKLKGFDVEDLNCAP